MRLPPSTIHCRVQCSFSRFLPTHLQVDVFSPPLPRSARERISWGGLPEGSEALAIANAACRYSGSTLVVAGGADRAWQLERSIDFFLRDLEDAPPVYSLPDWEVLPYDVFSPDVEIVSKRLRLLHRLRRGERMVLVVSVRAAMQLLPPRKFLDARMLFLSVGDAFRPQLFRERLTDAGYTHVPNVREPGEFAVRGSLFDLFAMGADAAYRVDLFDNEISDIRKFDPQSQRTTGRVERVEVVPAREFPLDKDTIARFRQAWHERFDVDVRRCPLYREVCEGHASPGVEFYLPLFFAALENLFDYMDRPWLVVSDQDTHIAAEQFQLELKKRYESFRHDVERPVLAPTSLYLDVPALFSHFKTFAQVRIGGPRNIHVLDTHELPDLRAEPKRVEPARHLLHFLASAPGMRVLFVAESPGRREVLARFLERAGISVVPVSSFAGFHASGQVYAIALGHIESGLASTDFAIIHEDQLFREDGSIRRRRAAKTRRIDPDQVIHNLTELNPGAPVVHISHGVGRYQGLTTLTTEGQTTEFLIIEYAEGAKLYLPVTSLELVSRYTGADFDHAPLHRLGSDAWQKTRRRAAGRIRDMAVELLDLYARREVKSGEALPLAPESMRELAESFAWELTQDQERAITETLDDLATEKPTDRLVCGDVGFGKTEVAMRAAYQTALAGRQTVLLVPTTLLAQQHFETFTDRFSNLGVTIAGASRLKSPADIAKLKQDALAGRPDILIGTHVLLGAGWKFDRLGLVIIDEEHRFGVRQKEALKRLRADVNVLSLTATPIPRTLNLALNGIRDLSIIATAPENRLPVRTFVRQDDRRLVQEAIRREIGRGGQVFYLHNEVRTIEQSALELAKLVPEAHIGIGHGQMPKQELERTMREFARRQTNLLVCSTIIESGIDIPNANTIIIERADRLGLAELHQLRGRVGRSNRQAYAYLLTPHPKSMTKDARKRLEAIRDAGELGIGFSLATHDLEIRGTGELLGKDQSGQIESIGYSMYLDMLSRAVESLRSGRVPDLDLPLELGDEVLLGESALIPDDYLPDVHQRLILYKRIASQQSKPDLEDLRGELRDRYGKLPSALVNLFHVARCKLDAKRLGIRRIQYTDQGGRIVFHDFTPVPPEVVIALVRDEPGDFVLRGEVTLGLLKQLESIDARAQYLEQLMARLAVPAPADASVSTKAAA